MNYASKHSGGLRALAVTCTYVRGLASLYNLTISFNCFEIYVNQ
jgi:hypothetical protein